MTTSTPSIFRQIFQPRMTIPLVLAAGGLMGAANTFYGAVVSSLAGAALMVALLVAFRRETRHPSLR
jgi:Flp pilus assembly protein protease CpaA